MGNTANFDPLRSLAFGSISGSYAAVGSPSTKRIRGLCFTNDTEGSMLFTNDITKDQLFVKSNSFKLWDVEANINDSNDDRYVFPIGTQFYVKQLAAPVSGKVYIEFLVDA